MSKQTSFKKYDLLGVEVDAITITEADAYITGWAADKTKGPAYIVKPYVEFIEQARSNLRIKQLLNEAELSLPDGVALSWATTYLYGGKATIWRLVSTLAAIVSRPAALRQVLPDRFAGANATWSLLSACRDHNLKIFIIASPGHNTLEHVKCVIETKLPGLQIVGLAPGHLNGLSGPKLQAALQSNLDITTLAASIHAAGADVILVGMGFPLQETLMSRLAAALTHGVLVGEGGTFDYDSFGGSVKRASRAWQQLGLEWLWRLGRDPRRLGRQLAIPRFIAHIYRAGRHAPSQN